MNLKDNFETRIVLIFLHFSIILIIFKKIKKIEFPQKIFDNIFQNIEYHLRELGFGDVAINKKMKLLNKNFYDILLKIEFYDDKRIKIKEGLIKKHFFSVGGQKLVKCDKIIHYLDNFYNFCFELDEKDIIKGQINYKY